MPGARRSRRPELRRRTSPRPAPRSAAGAGSWRERQRVLLDELAAVKRQPRVLDGGVQSVGNFKPAETVWREMHFFLRPVRRFAGGIVGTDFALAGVEHQ